MNDVRTMRERQLWIAVVAVLATSVVWLAAVDLVLIAHAWSSGFPVTLRVVRVLLRVAASMVGHAGPVIPAGLAVWPTVAILMWAPRAIRRERDPRHA